MADDTAWIVRRFADAESRIFGSSDEHTVAAPEAASWVARAYQAALDCEPPPSSDAPARTRLLLAESDDVSARVLRHRLERDGLEVVTAADGPAVLEALQEERFDAALIDIRVAGIAGFELLRIVRSGKTLDRDLPIVILCWPGNDSIIVRALDMGANDVIERPYSLSEASARIRRLVRKPEAP